MKRSFVVGVAVAALALLASAMPASAAGSLTDPCTLGDGFLSFDGPVGPAATQVTAPSASPVPPSPSVHVDPPGIDQLEPEAIFRSFQLYMSGVGYVDPGGYSVHYHLEDPDEDGIPGTLTSPSYYTEDPDEDGVPGSMPEPEVEEYDHDEDGVIDAVRVSTGPTQGEPSLGAGEGPAVIGIETHGSGEANPGTEVKTGGASSGDRAGSYTYEAPITCAGDWGSSKGTLSVGNIEIIADSGVYGEAVGTVACDGGEVNGQAVIEFTQGVMAGHAFLSTWHTKWLANVSGGTFEADGQFQYRGVVLEKQGGDKYFHPLVPADGGYAGTLARKDYTVDPDGTEGPQKSPSAKCTSNPRELTELKVTGTVRPIPLGE